MRKTNIESVSRRMQAAINSGVFPGAVLLVSYEGRILIHEALGIADTGTGQLMKKDAFFDLASLTKPLATALSVMKLVESGTVDVDCRLGDILAERVSDDKAGITVDQLLRHTSGLPAHRPYYLSLAKEPAAARRALMRNMIMAEPLDAEPGKRLIYSDLGYMVLAWIVEALTGVSFSQFVTESIYKRYGVEDLFFTETGDSDRLSYGEKIRFVPTENCPWRKKILRGEVHDDNAWIEGGADGHAGLFGTAMGVWRLLSRIHALMKGVGNDNLIRRDILLQFISKNSGSFDMVAGFDTPTPGCSSSGHFFSEKSIGHLGFTGTSFWMDPVIDLTVVMLTNRVHPSRDNSKIREFRPEIHDLIFRSVTG